MKNCTRSRMRGVLGSRFFPRFVRIPATASSSGTNRRSFKNSPAAWATARWDEYTSSYTCSQSLSVRISLWCLVKELCEFRANYRSVSRKRRISDRRSTQFLHYYGLYFPTFLSWSLHAGIRQKPLNEHTILTTHLTVWSKLCVSITHDGNSKFYPKCKCMFHIT